MQEKTLGENDNGSRVGVHNVVNVCSTGLRSHGCAVVLSCDAREQMLDGCCAAATTKCILSNSLHLCGALAWLARW